MTINYGVQLLDIKGTALFFVNPQVPHALVRRINRTTYTRLKVERKDALLHLPDLCVHLTLHAG